MQYRAYSTGHAIQSIQMLLNIYWRIFLQWATASFLWHSTHCSTKSHWNWLQSQQSLVQITVKHATISLDSLMVLFRHTHVSMIPRLTAALLFGHKRFVWRLHSCSFWRKLATVILHLHKQNNLRGSTKSVAMGEATV